MCIEVFGGEEAYGVLLGDVWMHLGFPRMGGLVSNWNAMSKSISLLVSSGNS